MDIQQFRYLDRAPPSGLDYHACMSAKGSVAQIISGLRSGEDAAARELWERYCTRLVSLARGKLPAGSRRVFDEEDIAISAFHSFCRGVQRGRFPRLSDESGLWGLLMTITARKALHRLRDGRALKRGAGRVRGESCMQRAVARNEVADLDKVIGAQPTPQYAAQLAEESEQLLNRLEDPMLRDLALLKLAGHTNQEIAAKIGSALRTVERRLELIRAIWSNRRGPEA